MLAIRLTRMGAKKRPFYRIVVAEKRSKRDGRFVEIVGHYNPCREPNELKLDHERIAYWLKCGAQPELKLSCENNYAVATAAGGFLRIKFRTVSVGCAPHLIQYAIRS